MIESSESHPPPRRRREKAQHHKEIIGAAIIVFAEKGFHAATLDEIAEKANCSKGGLYLHFQNKEDILFIALKETIEERNATLEKIVAGNRPFREELRDVYYQYAEDLFRQPNLFALLNAQRAALFQALSPENRRELFQSHNGLSDTMRQWVVKAIEKQEIRPFAEEAIIGMIHGSTTSMIFDRWHCRTLDELKTSIDIYIDMIFNGIELRKE
jgi:AcrR family transcriptional regulator